MRHALENLITEAQLMRCLHVSREAVARFRRRPMDPIPHVRAGRRYLYDVDAVLEWLQRQARPSRRRDHA